MQKRVYLILGIAMMLYAIRFIAAALGNPQESFPWDNSITYTVFAFYIIIMIGCFVMFLRKKK